MENIFDVFGIPVQEIPENAVLQWNGCDWEFIELPSSTLTCDDIVDCVQSDLDNLWAAVNGKLECSDLAACQTIIDIQDDITNLPATILGQVMYHINTLNDSETTDLPNGSTITINGLHGLHVIQNDVTGVLEFRLPSGANDGDVMVRDADNNGVVWSTIADCLCDQIANCPSITALENMYTTLQNQINYLLGLDPNSQPVLTCSDVANCIRNGATDTNNALDQFITNRQDWIDLLAEVGTNTTNISTNTVDINTNTTNIGNMATDITDIQNELLTITIRECADVMACQGIIDMGTDITDILARLNTAEGDILTLQTDYTTILGTVNNHEGRITANENDILTLQREVDANVIRTCNDVMACQSIIDMISNISTNQSEISNLYTRVTDSEGEIDNIREAINENVIRTCNDVMACPGIMGLISDVSVLDGRVTAIENCGGTGTGDMEKSVYDSANIEEQLVGISAEQTLSNKRIVPRVVSIVSSDTLTIDTDDYDAIDITELAVDIDMSTGLTGTPTNFQKLTIRIKDDGTSRNITWGSNYIGSLPTTTTIDKVLYVWLVYNSNSGKRNMLLSTSLDDTNGTGFTEVATVGVGNYPYGIAIDSGYAYVCNHTDDTVSKVDLSTFTEVATVGVGDSPYGIAIDSGYAYVCNALDATVSKVDLSTFTEVATVGVGNHPHGIAIDSGYAYVCNTSDDTVSKVDLSTFTEVATVGVGDSPHGIAIDSGYAYVCNASDDTVSKVDLT